MILSVDQLCQAAETTLKAALPDIAASAAFQALFGPNAAADYRPDKIKTWQQLPTIEAIVAAELPAIAITSPGMVDEPRFSRADNAYDVRFRLAIGVYERGRDHADTQARVRNWCALIRTALQSRPTLGGVAKGLSWFGEEYSLLPNRNTARTAAAGAVSVDVKASIPHHTNLGADLPSVTSTHPTVSVE